MNSDITMDPVGQRVIISGEFNCSQIIFGDQVITASYSLNANKGYVASYDSSGMCLWARGITGFDVDTRKVLTDQSSSVFVFGNADVSNATFQAAEPISIPPGGFVGRYSADGQLLRAERVLNNGRILGATWSTPTEFIMCGIGTAGAQLSGQSIGAELPGDDGYIARMDTTGNVAWITPFRSNNIAWIWNAEVAQNGDVMCMGVFKDSLITDIDTLVGPTTDFSYFICALNDQGVVQWIRHINSDVLVRVADLELGPDGDIYLYGGFQGVLQLPGTTLTASTSLDSFFARFDPTNGTCKAAYHYGRSNFGFGSLVPTANGLYIAGEYDSTMVLGSYSLEPSGPGAIDLVIAKFDSLSGFMGVQRQVLLDEELHIYANPNNGLCTIELPQSLRITNDLVLSVFDNTGNLVHRIPLTAGSEGIKLDIRAQAKGIYHVELGDGEQRYSGSIVFE